MTDIVFNPQTRELVLNNKDLTFAKSDMQHGAILLDSKADFLNSSMAGIGYRQVLGSSDENVNFELNRWVNQARSDGAKSAKFTSEVSTSGGVTNILEIAY